MLHPLIYTALIVGIDQWSKYLARAHLTLHDSVPVLGSFFHFTLVENSGIAFGINFSGGFWFFTVAAITATIVVSGYLWKIRHKSFFFRLSLALILGGAIGNLTDRILFGKVTDFFDFGLVGYHWPVFNVADSSVTVGMFLFLYLSLFKVSDSSLKNN